MKHKNNRRKKRMELFEMKQSTARSQAKLEQLGYSL